MAHAQKPDFVFRRNGRVPFRSAGASVQSIFGSRDVRISGSNAGYTTFRGSVRGTGYPLHSPVSPSHASPCAIRFQLDSNIESVSRPVDITAGGDFLDLCDQKSSYKHVSDFGRLRSYDRLKLTIEGNDY